MEYYLYHRRPVKECVPNEFGSIVEQYYDLGDMLVFMFVMGNGTPDKFGVDKNIFYLTCFCNHNMLASHQTKMNSI